MDRSKICIHCMGILSEYVPLCPHCGATVTFDHFTPDALTSRSVLNNRYLLGKVLKRDAYGFVYLALDQETNAVCTIREFFPAGLCRRIDNRLVSPCQEEKNRITARSAQMKRQYEAHDLLCRGGGEAIVTPLAQFEENQTFYLVTDYPKAVTLSDYIAQNGKLSPKQAFSLLKPIAQTLSKLHSFGVFHGGVHPEQILVLPDGRALLPAFGGVCPDTSHDVPPEQRNADGFIGPWTDAYAFAGCLYFSLVGAMPPEDPKKIPGILQDASKQLDKRFSDAMMIARSAHPENRANSLEELLHTMQVNGRSANPILWSLISIAACAVMVLMFLMGGSNGAAPDETMMATQPIETLQPSEPLLLQAQNEAAVITPGSYILANYAEPSLILGIENGYCDNGARLILTSYDPKNHNRILVTDHDPDDGFYNLQAAHTNSFLHDRDGVMVQHYAMKGLDSEKWIFLPCGTVNGQTVYTLRDAGGSALAPSEDLCDGAPISLTTPDDTDPRQMWYLIWNERDMNVPAVTVYCEGDIVSAPEGAVSILNGSSACVLNDDGILVTDDSASGSSLHIEPLPDGTCHILPQDRSSFLAYIPEEDCFRLQAASDSPNQRFVLVYAGFGTYCIRTAEGIVLSPDSSGSQILRGANASQADASAVWRLQFE